MAIDTIFICFCEDSDRNDGIDKPYFMSKGLMVSLLLNNNNNVTPKPLDL